MAGRGLVRREAGITLVELVVGMSVFAVVLTVIGALYLSTLTLARRGRALWELADAPIGFEAVTKELRQASRHLDGIVIWEREQDGIRHDAVGVFSTRIGVAAETDDGPAPGSAGWVYFVHDLTRGELRRIDQPSPHPSGDPPMDGGLVLARNVRSFSVTRDGALIRVTLVAARGGHSMRLQTEIWPRQD